MLLYIFNKINSNQWPVNNGHLIRNCSNRNCANYILAALPIKHKENNLLVCGTYYGVSKCISTKYDQVSLF
jgi:hypothetical protein